MSTLLYAGFVASDAGERPPGLAVWAELSELVDRVRILLNRDLQAAASLTLAENLVLCQVAMAPGGRLRMAVSLRWLAK